MLIQFFKGFTFDPDNLEEAEILQSLFRKIGGKTKTWMIKIFDEGIEDYVSYKQSLGKLVWTGFGPFAGDSGMLSDKDLDRFWTELNTAWPGNDPVAEKNRRRAGGTFFMWRISIRNET